VDRRREQAVDQAAARFADTLAESYRIVYEQATEARERQGRLAKDFSERVMDHLKEHTEPDGRSRRSRLTPTWTSSTPLSPSIRRAPNGPQEAPKRGRAPSPRQPRAW
jgi:hypothetical protein